MILKIVNENSISEWCVLEFQGEIVALNGLEARIQVCEDQVLLGIGQQILQGQLKTLEKPLMIATRSETDQSGNRSLSAVAFVYRKILFDTRPQPRTDNESSRMLFS
jgi:hypothetical protein